VTRPLQSPHTDQNYDSYSFDARIQILTEMYWYRHNLSIDPKKN